MEVTHLDNGSATGQLIQISLFALLQHLIERIVSMSNSDVKYFRTYRATSPSTLYKILHNCM